MFGKSLIVVLFGCALALASPFQRNANFAPQLGDAINIGIWLQAVHNETKETFKRIVQPFKETYISLVEAGKNGQKYNTDELEQLRSGFHRITDRSKEVLGDIENIVLTNTVVNLQTVIGLLSTRPYGTGFGRGMLGINMNIQAGQFASSFASSGSRLRIGQAGGVNQFGNQAQDPLNNLLHGVQNQFNQFVPPMNNPEGEQFQEVVYNSKLTLGNIEEQWAGAIDVAMNFVKQNLQDWKSAVETFLANGKSNEDNIQENEQVSKIEEEIANTSESIEHKPDVTEEILNEPKSTMPSIDEEAANTQKSIENMTNDDKEIVITQENEKVIVPIIDKEIDTSENTKKPSQENEKVLVPVIDKEVDKPKSTEKPSIKEIQNKKPQIQEKPIENEGTFSRFGRKVGQTVDAGMGKVKNFFNGFLNSSGSLFGK